MLFDNFYLIWDDKISCKALTELEAIFGNSCYPSL